jgi:hypothetical protein
VTSLGTVDYTTKVWSRLTPTPRGQPWVNLIQLFWAYIYLLFCKLDLFMAMQHILIIVERMTRYRLIERFHEPTMVSWTTDGINNSL